MKDAGDWTSSLTSLPEVTDGIDAYYIYRPAMVKRPSWWAFWRWPNYWRHGRDRTNVVAVIDHNTGTLHTRP